MQKNILTAFRLCGEFDGVDGDQHSYDNELAGDSDGYANQNQRSINDGSNQDSLSSIEMRLQDFPVLDPKKGEKYNEVENDDWELELLDADDEANKPDVVLRNFDFTTEGGEFQV